MRKFRIFGLGLGVVLALGALTASAAQAELTFTGLNPFGEHTQTTFQTAWTESTLFEFAPTASATSSVRCTKYNSSALASGESKTLTVKTGGNVPSCKEFPSEATTIRHMNSCDFTYHITKKIEADKYEGTTDIGCSIEGDVIEYEVLKAPEGVWCRMKLEEQTGIGPIYYIDHTPAMELDFFEIRAEATNVKSITDAPSKNPKDCGVTALGTHKTGTLRDTTTVTGLSEEIENSVLVSG